MASEKRLLWWDIEKHSQGVPSEAWLQDLRRNQTNHPVVTVVAPGDDTKKWPHGPGRDSRAGAEAHPLDLGPAPPIYPAWGLALRRPSHFHRPPKNCDLLDKAAPQGPLWVTSKPPLPPFPTGSAT